MSATSPPVANQSPLKDWATVVLLLALATGAGLLLDTQVSLTSQAMLYVLAVALAAYTVPWVPSLVCALGAVTALNFFFVPPRWTFAVDADENIAALVAMLVVALAISHLVAALRRQTAQAQRSAARAQQLQMLSTGLNEAQTPGQIRALGLEALHSAFAGPSELVVLQPDGQLGTEADPGTRDGMRRCMDEAAVLGPGTGRWPGLDAWYLPLGTRGTMTGAVCVRGVAASDEAGRAHAQAICGLLAQALLRLRLAASMQAARSEAERQQMQNTFLAAISHDLRTPLAVIVGAASALQAQRERLDVGEQERLLSSVLQEAAYLSRLTENTLQLVRLNNTTQPLVRDWESIEEIVGSVLARVRQHAGTRTINTRLAAGLPLIRVDAVLVAQLLANLLDNALKYSDGPIELVVGTDGPSMEIAVKDRGTAIAGQRRLEIFLPYVRGDQCGQHGAGLGLALCRAIAQAHGGALTLRARRGGGNSFVVSLPLEPVPPVGVPA